MITHKDLEERFRNELGICAYKDQFSEWVEEKYLELLNELAVVDEMTAGWVQACIEEEEIMAVNSFEFNQNSIVDELYKQNNE